MCARIFSDRSVLLHVVDQLAAIAECFGFDGWLINLENAVQFDQVGNLRVHTVHDFVLEFSHEGRSQLCESNFSKRCFAR